MTSAELDTQRNTPRGVVGPCQVCLHQREADLEEDEPVVFLGINAEEYGDDDDNTQKCSPNDKSLFSRQRSNPNNNNNNEEAWKVIAPEHRGREHCRAIQEQKQGGEFKQVRSSQE